MKTQAARSVSSNLTKIITINAVSPSAFILSVTPVSIHWVQRTALAAEPLLRWVTCENFSEKSKINHKKIVINRLKLQ
jgi:hypothetical protein